MKDIFFFIVLATIPTLLFVGSSLEEISRKEAEKLDKAETILLDVKACEIANLYLTNNNQKVLKIKNNTCLITQKNKFQVKYEGIDEYRLFIGKVNFLITEDSIVNSSMSVPNYSPQSIINRVK
jgi:hypothetical protein